MTKGSENIKELEKIHDTIKEHKYRIKRDKRQVQQSENRLFRE